MHAIANQDTIINIDPRTFFVPKIFISVLFFCQLMTMRLFVYIKYAQDPFFSVVQTEHLSFFYSILTSVGVILVLIYLMYFSMIAYRAF